MIQTSSIANLRHMQQDEIWLIVRSVGKAASLLSRPDVRWVPDLSPSNVTEDTILNMLSSDIQQKSPVTNVPYAVPQSNHSDLLSIIDKRSLFY